MKRLLFLLLIAAGAHAAQDGALSLSPAVITLRGEAGQSTTQTLLVRNGTSRALAFDVVAKDVVVRGGKRVMLEPGQIPASIAATAVFSQRRVNVPSGGSASVDVTVTIPQNAGARAIVALFRGTDTIHRATYSVGSLLTFTLSDNATLATDVLQVQPQSATSNLSVAQTCTNSGSEPLLARGMLAVIAADGRLAGKAEMKPHRLLPGERAQLAAQYGADLQPGRYRVLVTYDYEGRALTQSAEVTIP